MARKPKIDHVDYAELCDVLRIKINAARKASVAPAPVYRKLFLPEPQTPVAGTGSQMGDPRAGEARRTADVDGAYGRGTVKVPQKGENGRTKLVEVPGTEGNVREALAYWQSRKPRSDASRKAQSENVSLLTRRLSAMGGHKTPEFNAATGRYVTPVRAAGMAALRADVSPEGFTQHALPGPAIVQGPNMAPVQKMFRPRKGGQCGEPEVAAARLDGALTERLDRTVADERPKAHWTKSQRKNWRRKQQRHALRAAEARITAQGSRIAELEALVAGK